MRVLLIVAFVCGGCAEQRQLQVADEQLATWRSTALNKCAESRQNVEDLPPKPFYTDGCTLWPDSQWRHCCIEHDMDYWCGGNYAKRSLADKALQACVADTGHPAMGRVMRIGTRVTGASILPMPWRWGYGWPWPKSGE